MMRLVKRGVPSARKCFSCEASAVSLDADAARIAVTVSAGIGSAPGSGSSSRAGVAHDNDTTLAITVAIARPALRLRKRVTLLLELGPAFVKTRDFCLPPFELAVTNRNLARIRLRRRILGVP